MAEDVGKFLLAAAAGAAAGWLVGSKRRDREEQTRRGPGGAEFRRVGPEAYRSAPHERLPQDMGTLTAVPSRLTKMFGKPDDGDGYKTSTEWLFQNELGELVSVHDRKQTSLYAEDLPSPARLRASRKPIDFRIGASSTAALADFADWMREGGAQLDIDVERFQANPDEGCIGTVSRGTLLAGDLIPKFIDALDERLEASTFEEGADEPARVQQLDNVQTELGELERRTQEQDYYESEESDWDLEWLHEQLNEYAPEGCYFGAHWGDPADFGFWYIEESQHHVAR